ncbi:MAG: glycosyl transferase [Synechococcaceae cyanobacterium SM2_3_60]|nr:glycosyl transferase [Synechococcaceae cyanobacterium SM2_3_60]
MPIPIYAAITSHGFGHITRTATILNRWQQLNPEILPIFVTTAPHWLLAQYMQGPFLQRPLRLDVGVVQADSVQMDLAATKAQVQALQADAARLVRAEADFCRLNRVRLIYADIPPLATAIAKAAAVPCVMVSNFGWDLIYRAFAAPNQNPAFYDPEFAALADWCAELYAGCDLLLQVPLNEPMPAFPHRQQVGLIASEPRHDPEWVRAQLGLARDRPTLLLTFGGMGLNAVPYTALDQFPDWQFLTFRDDIPDLPNLYPISGSQWRPIDVMPLCDHVVTKPGYSTIAEALRLGVPVRCLDREGFAESPYLVEGLRRYSQHQIVPPVALESWDWLEATLTEPSEPAGLDREGNATVVAALEAQVA